MDQLKLKPLSNYNKDDLNNHQIALRSGVSYPTVVKYMQDDTSQPTIIYVIKLLAGMGIDWQDMKLGDLVE